MSRPSHTHIVRDYLLHTLPSGGGGGGGVGGGGERALGYLGGGGRIRSLSKLKNTPKALISGQKAPLF